MYIKDTLTLKDKFRVFVCSQKVFTKSLISLSVNVLLSVQFS